MLFCSSECVLNLVRDETFCLYKLTFVSDLSFARAHTFAKKKLSTHVYYQLDILLFFLLQSCLVVSSKIPFIQTLAIKLPFVNFGVQWKKINWLVYVWSNDLFHKISHKKENDLSNFLSKVWFDWKIILFASYSSFLLVCFKTFKSHLRRVNTNI